MKCPKCFYTLILREYSRKYKCCVCKKLYPQSEIELKEFLEFNKKEKEKDTEILQKDIDARIQELLQERQITLAFNSITRECNKRQAVLFDRVLDRDEYNRKKREYWARCRNHLLEKRKENYFRNIDKIRRQQKQYRDDNKILRRINHLRTRQKELALKLLKEDIFKVYE